MSNAMPYIRFFPTDWTGDMLLRMVGPAERGLWIDLLCLMAECEPYGHLCLSGAPMPDERAAAACGLTLDTYRALLANLESVEVTSRTDAGVIYSRRLVRDHAEFMRSSRAGKSGGGNPAIKNTENIQKPYPEAISIRAREPNPPLYPPLYPPLKGVGVTSTPEFDQFWAAYPRKVGKKAALKAWNAAKDKPAAAAIISAVNRAKECEQWQKDGGQYIPHPATWLNQGRWDDGMATEGQPADIAPRGIVRTPEQIIADLKREGKLPA